MGHLRVMPNCSVLSYSKSMHSIAFLPINCLYEWAILGYAYQRKDLQQEFCPGDSFQHDVLQIHKGEVLSGPNSLLALLQFSKLRWMHSLLEEICWVYLVRGTNLWSLLQSSLFPSVNVRILKPKIHYMNNKIVWCPIFLNTLLAQKNNVISKWHFPEHLIFLISFSSTITLTPIMIYHSSFHHISHQWNIFINYQLYT